MIYILKTSHNLATEVPLVPAGNFYLDPPPLTCEVRHCLKLDIERGNPETESETQPLHPNFTRLAVKKSLNYLTHSLSFYNCFREYDLFLK